MATTPHTHATDARLAFLLAAALGLSAGATGCAQVQGNQESGCVRPTETVQPAPSLVASGRQTEPGAPQAEIRKQPLPVADPSLDSSLRIKDSRGKEVVFPLGARSFADEVVSYEVGNPAPFANYQVSGLALGLPDYIDEEHDKARPTCPTLGCGGTLTLRFADNALIDVVGPDLYVFEVGPSVEPTDLAISKDGRAWIRVGTVSGGTAEIDIHEFVRPGDVFHYVRLTDVKADCGGTWPGADIDAVGAIGSARQLSLSASVLFDFNQSSLKPEAQSVLEEAFNQVAVPSGSRIIIEGHTDAVGTDAYNEELSKRRAEAVKAHLPGSASHRRDVVVETRGCGETRPIATNDTEEGREANRRVEIVIVLTAAL